MELYSPYLGVASKLGVSLTTVQLKYPTFICIPIPSKLPYMFWKFCQKHLQLNDTALFLPCDPPGPRSHPAAVARQAPGLSQHLALQGARAGLAKEAGQARLPPGRPHQLLHQARLAAAGAHVELLGQLAQLWGVQELQGLLQEGMSGELLDPGICTRHFLSGMIASHAAAAGLKGRRLLYLAGFKERESLYK